MTDVRGRATRKPVPVTLAAWKRELDGVTHFLSQCPATGNPAGDAWAASMISYYKERQAHLLANKPKPKSKRK